MKFSIILKKIKVNRKTTGLIEQDQLLMLRERIKPEQSQFHPDSLMMSGDC